MKPSGGTGLRACAAVLFSAPLVWPPACPAEPPASAAPLPQAALARPVAASAALPAQGVQDLPFAGRDELSVDELVEQVLAHNPSLAQMVAAWQAASARYPQVTSLDDPMFGVMTGPAAFGSNKVDGAYRLELSQKYPFPGKLGLRGQTALAEASAAGREVEDTRLQLVESARNAFYDYYLAGRALAVNAETVKRLEEFRAAAAARFRSPTGRVSIQDVYQADVEIGRQHERQLFLERMRQVAVARINSLLHLPPDSALPPPPAELHLAESVPEARLLRATALAQRPDLRALADRIQAEQAALGLARKEFYPDYEVTAAYDAFWQERQLRPMVGVRVNLPVRKSRRYGAVAEAEARIAQRQAELARLSDQVNFQVQEAYAQVRESERAIRLYKERILPDAELNVKAARADYVTGLVPAVSVIEAERNRLNLYDRYYETLAQYFRRRAALERAVGGPLVPLPDLLGPERPGHHPGG
jgi:cobalt-zinc-cadmium efflux system outer membrane protein